jgi:DNA-binding NtrC family response regulator
MDECFLVRIAVRTSSSMPTTSAAGTMVARDRTISFWPDHLELPSEEAGSLSSYHQQVESLRRRLVEEALEESEGNRAEAARKLGVSRQALSYLVKQLRIAGRPRRI